MDKKHLLAIFLLGSFTLTVSAQDQLRPAFNDLRADIIKADNTSDMLMTNAGLNIFLQRKALQYLTGVSDLALAKFYATYTTDNDKLNLGFNIPVDNDYSQLLHFIINPILEADVKKSFAKLYEDDKWKNNIRAGIKITWLPGKGTLNFYDVGTEGYRKPDFNILRKKKYDELLKKYNDEQGLIGIVTKQLDGNDVTSIQPEELTARQLKKKKNELYVAVGTAEADYLEKERSYAWYQNFWISLWGFTPLTKAEQYISPNSTQLFTKTKFKLWEVNLQATYMMDWKRFGTIYPTVWLRHFNNNSANADLLTAVDYNQYTQFPGANPLNFALIESDKAFIGDFKEFVTTNLIFQFVYMTPLQTLFKPGLSIRYEKNYGDYSPANWRFGIPVSIQGKEKPISIELQYRLTDVSNYKNVIDHKTKKTVGVSLGVPFALLYK